MSVNEAKGAPGPGQKARTKNRAAALSIYTLAELKREAKDKNTQNTKGKKWSEVIVLTPGNTMVYVRSATPAPSSWQRSIIITQNPRAGWCLDNLIM